MTKLISTKKTYVTKTHTWAGSWTQGGAEKFPPGGQRPGRGGGRKFFYPGGSLLVKIGQNFFTWGVIW